MLDAHGNGWINSEEIELDYVPNEVLLVLKPLLVEIEIYQESLNLSEFINSSFALLESLTTQSRNIILNFDASRKPVQESPSFQPLISDRTKQLASKANQRKGGGSTML